MKEFIKELELLPQDRQKAIREGLQSQIVAQAVFVRDEQPTKFLAYIDEEIAKADASMLKMVQESSQEGAELGAISEIYIWNKERKKALIKLRDGKRTEPEQTAPEPQQTKPEVLNNDKAKELFKRAISKGLISTDGDKYKWNDTASLYGYFVDKTSDFLNIRPSNNRVPWIKYKEIISNHSELLATAKQAVNDYKNKELNPPEGDDKVNDICR
ncbi:hypothetical protein [Prevotella sp. P6B4]|jgi:hypothetical protein|uniref:hypothetical protein n=1 Tax=Prevotella sp. P6B4 TaxID=1410614 RepID=UPI0004915795|nr:hypothetical protein [Prevotella sp. P6B4]